MAYGAPCPCCGGREFAPFAHFGMLPASGQFPDGHVQALRMGELSFAYCPQCAFIRQAGQQAPVADYSEVARRTRRQLPDYAPGILERLRLHTQADDLVVEVGANDGSFLELLRTSGFARRLGVEPSRPLAALCAQEGHAVENVHLTPYTARAIVARHGHAQAVICRHTLEHVPDPLALMGALRALLRDGGVAYIEVPATAPIVDDLQGQELWDEHLSYFSPGNLRALAQRGGLLPLRCEEVRHRTSRNLMLWAGAGSASTHVEVSAEPASRDQCAGFAGRWQAYSARMREQARGWTGPVIAMGASHPQTNYLLLTGLGQHIDLLVDDDESKAGRYAALPRLTPIESTQQVLARATRGGTLLLSAFGYPRWTQQLSDALSARGFLLVELFAALGTTT